MLLWCSSYALLTVGLNLNEMLATEEIEDRRRIDWEEVTKLVLEKRIHNKMHRLTSF